MSKQEPKMSSGVNGNHFKRDNLSKEAKYPKCDFSTPLTIRLKHRIANKHQMAASANNVDEHTKKSTLKES